MNVMALTATATAVEVQQVLGMKKPTVIAISPAKDTIPLENMIQ